MAEYAPTKAAATGGSHIEQSELHRIRSAGALTISAEMFEKIYLTPKTFKDDHLRKKFANPTPLGLMGYAISVCTFSAVLMGWGGANSLHGVAGIFFFTGPVLLWLATIFEFICGNFFPMMCFGLFTVFWLSFGVLQLPTLGLAASYSASGTDYAEGVASPGYNATLAVYLCVWGFALFTFFVFSLRTNAVFAAIFLFAFVGVFILAGAYWQVSMGNFALGNKLTVAGAAVLFMMGLLGWYVTAVIMAAEMRMNISLPVGDLSRFWPRSDVSLADLEKEA